MTETNMVERESTLVYLTVQSVTERYSVLHLAASSTTQQAYTFFSILLRNPNIFVNFQDYESGYTALHRALFGGNIRAARDLLARGDIDMSIKDAEGLTAFDLYNGTVDGVGDGIMNDCGTQELTRGGRPILNMIPEEQIYTSGESIVRLEIDLNVR